MPDYAILKAKIEADHANDTPAQIVAALNAKTIPVRVPIATRDIRQYLILKDLWLAIKYANTDASKIAMDALDNFETFTVSNPLVDGKLAAVLDALVAETQVPDFTETHKAEIMSLGDSLVSWADRHWDGNIQIWQIKEVLDA